jgi:hypothetical protein
VGSRKIEISASEGTACDRKLEKEWDGRSRKYGRKGIVENGMEHTKDGRE